MRTAAQKYKVSIAVDPNIPDFSKSPFIIKKIERARDFIAKHGLPKEKPKNEKSKKG